MKSISRTTGFMMSIVILTSLWSCGGSYLEEGGIEGTSYPETVVDVGPDDFPDHGAVILVNRMLHVYSMSVEPTKLERIFRVKVLSQEGIDDFGDYLSKKLPTKGVKFHIDASVTSPAGKKTDIGGSDIRKVIIGNRYCQYRIAFPGLEVGSIIEIREKIEIDQQIMSGYWDFATHVPTLRSELIFMVPKGVDVSFNFTPRESHPRPQPKEKDRYHVYDIVMEAVPPYEDEMYMPRQNVGNPSLYYYVWQIDQEDAFRFYFGDKTFEKYRHDLARFWTERNVTYSFFTTWKNVGELYTRYFDPFTWHNADQVEEYRVKFDELIAQVEIADRSDIVQTLDAILEVFHKRFNAVDFDYYWANPEETMMSGEGTPFELAYVLKRLLDELNVISTVVVVRDVDRGLFDKRNVDPMALHHPLLLVQSGNEQYWIDPSAAESGANQLPWKCEGVVGFWLKTEEDFSFITTPLGNERKTCFKTSEQVELNDNGDLEGRVSLTLTGQHLLNLRENTAIGEMNKTNEDLAQFLDANFTDVFQRRNLGIETDTRDTLAVSFEYTATGFADRSGDYLNVDMSPWCQCPVRRVFEEDTRKYDVVFPFLATRHSTVKIKAPEGYAIVDAPQAVDETNGCFTYRKTCFEQSDEIVFARSFAITSPRVKVEDYPEAREFIQMTRAGDTEALVLRRSP